MRLQAERREMEWHTGTSQAALHFVGDEESARLRGRRLRLGRAPR
jgi:hypothetical protein